jgi:DNA-binding XRE family transcriptional regulator
MSAKPFGDQSGRSVLKCDDCRLVQYESKAGKCVRCHLAYRESEPIIELVVDVPPVSRPAPLSLDNATALVLKMLRLALGLSQTQLASRMRCTQAFVSKKELGVSLPKCETFVRFAAGFWMTPQGLVAMCEAAARAAQ